MPEHTPSATTPAPEAQSLERGFDVVKLCRLGKRSKPLRNPAARFLESVGHPLDLFAPALEGGGTVSQRLILRLQSRFERHQAISLFTRIGIRLGECVHCALGCLLNPPQNLLCRTIKRGLVEQLAGAGPRFLELLPCGLVRLAGPSLGRLRSGKSRFSRGESLIRRLDFLIGLLAGGERIVSRWD